ncbi:MAG: hypothetical protein WCI73_07295, partial [Phycisphaerae bacterium]
VAHVTYWVKRSPLALFHWSGAQTASPGAKPAPPKAPWVSVPAQLENGSWVATIPAAMTDEQIVVYAMVEDSAGNKVSSDTVESPAYPAWRAVK